MPKGPTPTLVLALAALSLHGGAGCIDEITTTDTVDLGDHFEPPETVVDEDTYHCVIEPEVVTQFRCAAGMASDGDGCHTSRSALRLVEVPTPSRCADGRVIGAPAAESVINFERVRASVSVDAEASPFYRRPVGLDSHPRVIFAEDSAAAQQVRAWIERGAP